MSEQATLQSIARSRSPEEFSPGAGAMSVTLTNAEKQARYRERHLGVDGEQVRVAFNLNAGANTMDRPRASQWLYNN
jgi:hypothetical protein